MINMDKKKLSKLGLGNKLLLRTHLVVLVAKLGFWVWRFVDGLLNRILPKAEHFIIVMKKR